MISASSIASIALGLIIAGPVLFGLYTLLTYREPVRADGADHDGDSR